MLIVDKRPHIGGNAYDHYDDDGHARPQVRPAHLPHQLARRIRLPVAVHRVAALPASRPRLGRRPAGADPDQPRHHQHALRAEPDVVRAGGLLPSPSRRRATPVRTSEDVIVSKVGRELYEKFFRNYTRKQWGLDPSELDASVTARVPVRTNRDDRYFTDTYQAMPLHGYTRMFERMLAHPNIKMMLNTDYREIERIDPVSAR